MLKNLLKRLTYCSFCFIGGVLLAPTLVIYGTAFMVVAIVEGIFNWAANLEPPKPVTAADGGELGDL